MTRALIVALVLVAAPAWAQPFTVTADPSIDYLRLPVQPSAGFWRASGWDALTVYYHDPEALTARLLAVGKDGRPVSSQLGVHDIAPSGQFGFHGLPKDARLLLTFFRADRAITLAVEPCESREACEAITAATDSTPPSGVVTLPPGTRLPSFDHAVGPQCQPMFNAGVDVLVCR